MQLAKSMQVFCNFANWIITIYGLRFTVNREP